MDQELKVPSVSRVLNSPSQVTIALMNRVGDPNQKAVFKVAIFLAIREAELHASVAFFFGEALPEGSVAINCVPKVASASS